MPPQHYIVKISEARMGRPDISSKIVDLATYRAARAARRETQSRIRYVLWYPGIGCFRPRAK
jgi:hypothetical protein